MKIIINGSSMVPIYEQIMEQVKAMIRTVKKAYDAHEQEGFTVTVHGKGTYVAAANTELLMEESRKEVEADLEMAIQKGKRCGLTDTEIRQLFDLIMEG